MNKRVLATVGALALFVATVAWAAEGAATSEAAGGTSGKSMSAGGGKSGNKFTGCLAKGDEAGEFKLTNVNGGSEEYELVGGKDLKDHVGHKVEITGKKMSSKRAAKAEKEGTEAEAGHEHLKVKSMKHIAATCP